jgi:hypothetical protein
MAADWKAILAKVAPFIGAAASGNVPVLVGLAAQEIGAALGKEVKPTSEAIGLALSGATPEQLLAIKESERGFEVKMKALGFQHEQELEALAAGDRASARQREIATNDSTPRRLAYIIVIAFIVMVVATLFGEAKVESALAGTLVGYLSAKCEQVLAYFFGSTSNSARKTEIITEQANRPK